MKTNKKQTLDYQAPTTEVVVLVSECVMGTVSGVIEGDPYDDGEE